MSHDFQNAYHLGGQIAQYRNDNARALINEAIRDGLVPVVLESVAYCPYTDAILSFPGITFIKAFETREAAEAYIIAENAEHADDFGFGEDELVIYPKPPRVPSPNFPFSNEDDIPF